jgi:hypothetical protein
MEANDSSHPGQGAVRGLSRIKGDGEAIDNPSPSGGFKGSLVQLDEGGCLPACQVGGGVGRLVSLPQVIELPITCVVSNGAACQPATLSPGLAPRLRSAHQCTAKRPDRSQPGSLTLNEGESHGTVNDGKRSAQGGNRSTTSKRSSLVWSGNPPGFFGFFFPGSLARWPGLRRLARRRRASGPCRPGMRESPRAAPKMATPGPAAENSCISREIAPPGTAPDGTLPSQSEALRCPTMPSSEWSSAWAWCSSLLSCSSARARRHRPPPTFPAP